MNKKTIHSLAYYLNYSSRLYWLTLRLPVNLKGAGSNMPSVDRLKEHIKKINVVWFSLYMIAS